MRIAQLVSQRKSMTLMSERSAKAWRIVKDDYDPYQGTTYQWWHYGTKMAEWNESTRYGIVLTDWDTGYGSVSDQNGMNILFRELGLPYRFDRAGGAKIVNWKTGEVL